MSKIIHELELNCLSDRMNGGLSEDSRQQLSKTVAKLKADYAILTKIAESCLAINEENKKNFPHRSPEWAGGFYGDSPTQAAMNDLLRALSQYEASKTPPSKPVSRGEK